jgi:hypothetical protein
LSYTLLIGHVHCVTNPILYCFLHKTFRHYVFRCFSGNVNKKSKAGILLTMKYGVQHMMNTMAIAIHNFASRRRLSVRFRRLLSRSLHVRPFLLVICISALNFLSGTQAKLCIAIAIVFIICWTPYFIVNTYLDFHSDINDLDILSYTLLMIHLCCLGYLDCDLNNITWVCDYI